MTFAPLTSLQKIIDKLTYQCNLSANGSSRIFQAGASHGQKNSEKNFSEFLIFLRGHVSGYVYFPMPLVGGVDDLFKALGGFVGNRHAIIRL